jgi:hypothetical protein
MQVQEWSGCTRLILQPALIDGLQYLMNSFAGNPKDHCNLSLRLPSLRSRAVSA